eukprot:1806076-Amphidinium_carterae.1
MGQSRVTTQSGARGLFLKIGKYMVPAAPVEGWFHQPRQGLGAGHRTTQRAWAGCLTSHRSQKEKKL